MSVFSDVVGELESFAKKEYEAFIAEGKKIEQAVVPVVETGLVTAARDFGSLAVRTAYQFMQAEFAVLTGQEKHGRVVTTLLQSAQAAGKQLALSDAQALATNAFVAAVGAIGP